MNIFNKKNIKLSNVDKILIIIITLLIVFNFTNWFCNILGIGVDCSIKEGKSKKAKRRKSGKTDAAFFRDPKRKIKNDKKRQRRREAGKTTKAYKKKQDKIDDLRDDYADLQTRYNELDSDFNELNNKKNIEIQNIKTTADNKYGILADDVNNLEEVYDIIEDELDAGSNFYAALGSGGDLNTDLTGVTLTETDDGYGNTYVSSRTTKYQVDGDDIYTVNDLISKISDFFGSISSNTDYQDAV